MSVGKVFVYGTLRQGSEVTHELQDYAMYVYQGRDFQFPYIMPSAGAVVYGCIREVDDEELALLDKYENVRSGLYTRDMLSVYDTETGRGEEAWVYVAGPALLPVEVASGDWFDYINRS